MATNSTKDIDKKLLTLRAAKQKEEDKLNAAVTKMTDAYNESVKKLKEQFDAKIGSTKAEANEKITGFKKEIDFYEGKKKQIEKLEAEMRALYGDVDQRITSKGE